MDSTTSTALSILPISPPLSFSDNSRLSERPCRKQNLRICNMEGGDRTYERRGSSLVVLLQLEEAGGGSSPSSSSSSFSSTGTTGHEEAAESSPEISLLDEDRFFRRLLTRESASSGPGLSSRFYYRAAGKVPFDWEIAPGKPKKSSQDDKLPPLSPPPSVRVALPRSLHEPEKSRFWFLNASPKRISNRLRRGTIARHGGNRGLSSGPAGCPEDLPATDKEFVWPASGGTYSCPPFHFSGFLGMGRRSSID